MSANRISNTFVTLFPAKTGNQSLTTDENSLLKEADYDSFVSKSLDIFKKDSNDVEAYLKDWQLFCVSIKAIPETAPENLNKNDKLLLVQTIFQCLKNSIQPGEMAQLLRAAADVKHLFGTKILKQLLEAKIPSYEKKVVNYLEVCKLLTTLHEETGINKLVETALPNITLLIQKLKERHAEFLKKKYPEKPIDETIAKFKHRDEIIQFPLSDIELDIIKAEYEKYKTYFDSLHLTSLSELKEKVIVLSKTLIRESNSEAKYELIAIISEMIHRLFGIQAHDTQILSLLALINFPEKLKGRIAQIQTGEGKSTIIAMLSAYMGSQGHFVDVVTSSDYLAKRDAEKYRAFYDKLGLSVSFIHHHSKKEDFRGQILYGTNTAFEFAHMRDGLYQQQLRFSFKNGQLEPRTFDVAVIDEADNLFLDAALNSALMSIAGNEDLTWIYQPILNFVKQQEKSAIISKKMLDELRQFLINECEQKHHKTINTFQGMRLRKWLLSAFDALYKKNENQDYIVKRRQNDSNAENEIVIADVENTGRLHEGSQWRGGLHQFLQAKHHFKITPESLTAASFAHPTYFSLYTTLLGLTGTMGEKSERDEILNIYHLDSFDVPPYQPNLRKILAPQFASKENHFEAIFKFIDEMQKQGRPILILFKTIEESEKFTKFLKEKGKYAQLINENQREAEEYLIARAGEVAMITIATNTAGRGADINLTPESRSNGGLLQLFTFYPKNTRVQGQGYGRANRQGDPGNCGMILNYEDNFVLFLIRNKNIDLTKMTPDKALYLLNQLRSERIKDESEILLQSSKFEALCFDKLKIFFDNMKVLQEKFEDILFKESIMKSCTDHTIETTYTTDEIYFDEQNLKQLSDAASTLLEQQYNGIAVDWSIFFEQFKQIYFLNVRRTWAFFYNKLHDEIDTHNIKEAKIQIEKLYQDTWPMLDRLLNDPTKNISNIMQQILQTASEKIIHRLMPTVIPRLG